MTSTASLRAALFAASLGAAVIAAPLAQAESFASSASSAGSASSGSVSDSLQGSSNSSTGNNNRRADGTYQILDVTPTPGRANSARIAMQLGADKNQRIVLDLPQTVADKQALNHGMLVQVKNRDYGLEFARFDNRQAFFLVLADEVYNELAARKVVL